MPTFLHLFIKNWYFTSMDLLHINIFYQYLVDGLLNLITHLFFLIQNLQLLIFFMDDLEYRPFGICCFIFTCNIIKINHFIPDTLFSNSVLHTFPAFAPYGYDVILWKVCNRLSSLLLNAILWISSVYTLCNLFLNLCCDFNIISLFSKQFL